jgi:uridine monophosphate synthetase
VQFNEKGDGLGQQYQSPSDVIGTKLSDVVIVGRGIYTSSDPKVEAIKYQEAAWQSYLDRITNK